MRREVVLGIVAIALGIYLLAYPSGTPKSITYLPGYELVK